MDIGIDKIGFYTPHLFVDLTELAVARAEAPEKYTIGIGQEKMAVAPQSQDIVSMAANAALAILDEEDREKIDLIIVGTESGIDASKSAAVSVQNLLKIQPHARAMEIKHACYGATAGLQMAKGHIALNPESRALVIGTDIARYGLATGGEVTQGAGAVAMVVSANPRILAFDRETAYTSNDIADFWRPSYSEYAMVDGKYSNEQYIAFFENTWKLYKEKTNRTLADFAAVCFHLPYTKMGWKAMREVLSEASEEQQERLAVRYKASTQLNRNVGNIYTGSLYLSFLSLLEHAHDLRVGDRIGFYSYGSGAVGEFFSGTLVEGYREQLGKADYALLLEERTQISVPEYERIFLMELPTDGSSYSVEQNEDPSPIRLAGVKDHKRLYVIQ